MLRPGHAIFLCALTLLTLGVVMVQSAGMQVTPIGEAGAPGAEVTAESLLTSSTAQHLLIALAAMGIASLLPVRRIANWFERRAWMPPAGDSGLLAIGAVLLVGILVTVYVPGIARPRYGAHRWVDLRIPGFTSMQPSEFAKWGLVLLIAFYAARLAKEGRDGFARFWSGFVPPIIAIGLVCSVVVLEDLGTAVLMGLASALVLLASGARIKHFAVFVPPAAALVVAAVMTSDYRMKRITAFLRPYEDPDGIGYQMIQSLSTISGGGIAGRGLGGGLQKFGYLPEDTTDFLFAVVCEELGVAGALVVVLLYATIAWIGTQIAHDERSVLLRLITIGVVATFTIQALMNLMVVTGLGPTKGIALPLMSSGGTGWLVTSFCLGLVISIDRTKAHTLDPFFEHEDEDEEDAPEIVVRAKQRSASSSSALQSV